MSLYGLQQLVLLNSANYERAEVPLDDSVSIIGPNNAGKTSLINALQFLLVNDRRQMSFGAHDMGDTLRFYFPTQSSFVLLEAQLESGTVTMGCVGKGASHEYQLFAYSGSLRIEDYRRSDGTLVDEPSLREHLSQQGISVHYFNRSSDYFDALFGRTKGGGSAGRSGSGGRPVGGELDLQLFKLESSQHRAVFQQILVRTLRLDHLRADEVKGFLLKIFSSEYGADIDFKAVWHRAFDQVNSDRAQYLACNKHKGRVEELAQAQQERLTLRGKISYLRPRLDRALQNWESHRQETSAQLATQRLEVEAQQRALQQQYEGLLEERIVHRNRLAELRLLDEEQRQLEAEYAFLEGRAPLEERLAEAQSAWEQANALLHQARTGNLAHKQRELQAAREQVHSLQRQLEMGERLMGPWLHGVLNATEMALLHGMLQKHVLELELERCGDAQQFATRFRKWLEGQGDHLEVMGLQLERAQLERPYRRATPEELRGEVRQVQAVIRQLEVEEQALQDRQAQEDKTRRMLAAMQEAQHQLKNFDRLTQLREQKPEREADAAVLRERQGTIERLIEQIQQEQEGLTQRLLHHTEELRELERQHQAIAQLRSLRKDAEERMLHLEQLAHHPWIGADELEMQQLSTTLQQQNQDCRTLDELDRSIRATLQLLAQAGFTKFLDQADEDEQIRLMVNYANHLDREAEALQRSIRSAVTSVASHLQELDRMYVKFLAELRRFNQLIGKRRLSDLELFRIEALEHPYLVGAIRTLLQSSEALAGEETIDIFRAADADAVGNEEVDRAKDQLFKISESQGSLKLEHLFELQFEVARRGQPTQRFDQLDKIGSNGTVLMAKLISGLALLHQMLSRTHQTHTICYLDEAASLDDANQVSLIETAREFGFHLLFASPTPQNTVRYCVPIERRGKMNFVSRQHWQIFEELDESERDARVELPAVAALPRPAPSVCA